MPSVASISAPFSTSHVTVSVRPCAAAHSSGVIPSVFLISRTSISCSWNLYCACITSAIPPGSTKPPFTARNNAVSWFPSVSRNAYGPETDRRYSTISLPPNLDASMSGVRPLPSLASLAAGAPPGHADASAW